MTGGRRSRFGADLKTVLAERDFRKLFGTRLVAQTGDGIVTAAVGTYVFFNASTFPNPMAGAAAFAVLYLPYSLIGPFAGVFLDRWSRRQILVWSAPIRGALVVVTAGLMVANIRSVPLYIAVLAVSAVSRFLLSALSVAIPHVTPANKLVVANAVSDTIGGMMSALGGIIALGINAATGDTERGAAVTMLVGGGCYVAAGMVATIMPRDLLGPRHIHRGPAPDGKERHRIGRGSRRSLPEGRPAVPPEVGAKRVGADLREVAAGLLAGARYVLGRRGPRAALGATSAYSFLFGPLFLMTILLYRNYFFPAQVTVAESHVGRLAVFSAVGYVCAALITPPATRRLSKHAWITLMLIAAAVGLTLGAVNGALVWLARIPSIVVTLGTLSIYRGLAFLASGGTSIVSKQMSHAFIAWPRFEIAGLPLMSWFAIAMVAVFAVFLGYTRPGRAFFAVGGNPVAAVYAGLNVGRTQFVAFCVSGAIAGFCG